MWLTISSCYGSISLVFGLIVRDGVLTTLGHSCGFFCKQSVLKTFPGPDYLHSEDGIVWPWPQLVNLYIWLTISSCYGSIPLGLGLIVNDGGLSTLCHSGGFACQQRVLKTFPGPGYLLSEDGVVWIWDPVVYFYIWLTISSCYGSIPLVFGLIVRDGVLSTLCHSCGFAGQQRVLRKFRGPDCLHSEYGVVCLWHPLANLYIWLSISTCYGSIRLALGSAGWWWFEHSMS